mgnify:FL=1
MTDQDLFNSISARLEHARTKHPLFAHNERHGLKVIRDEFLELTRAVDGEAPDRQKDEALDVIATCCRFVLEERKKEEKQ